MISPVQVTSQKAKVLAPKYPIEVTTKSSVYQSLKRLGQLKTILLGQII